MIRKLQAISIHFYAYLVIGPMLVLVNTPVFLLVMLPFQNFLHLILATVFFNSALTGMSAILIGAKRWSDFVVQEQFIVHYDCVFDHQTMNSTISEISVADLFFINVFFHGWSLLMNSVERFCVVAFPLYYYTHNKRIIFALIITQYAITAIAIIFTAVASLIESKRYISHFCISTASLFSIIVMVIVVALLKRRFKAQFLSKNSCNRDLTHFIKNQKRYTHTALISCSFTFCINCIAIKKHYVKYRNLLQLIIVYLVNLIILCRDLITINYLI
uniref:G-protein coupled receptors family 1 profile domain-containing protein n=1 Tax=Wuchereria bancrofti TaxID=6293 RepID=A0AAF5PWY5_WUCBA